MSIDFIGAAQLLDERAARWAQLLARFPALVDCYRMLVTNPELAEEAAKAIKKVLAKHPDHRDPKKPAPDFLFKPAANQ